MKSDDIAHTKDEIEHALRRGWTPLTDNRSLLVELGFQPRADEPEMWERSVDYGFVTTGRGVRRTLARQRARMIAVSLRR